jgi:uncharacterized protein
LLTVEHVRLRRTKGIVNVVSLCGVDRPRALEIASDVVQVVREHQGEPRSVLEEALAEIPVEDDSLRLSRALQKLALDAVDFDVESDIDPPALRFAIFKAAAQARAKGEFDRSKILESTGIADIERALFADLHDAHIVQNVEVRDADELIARCLVGEIQAVILRATRLVVDVDATPTQIRALLRAAKLHQLLFEVEESGDDGIRLSLEGPLSLFQSVTRYGLKLACLVPAIRACRRWHIEANVKLRKGGAPEKFVASGIGSGDIDDTPPEIVSKLFDDLSSTSGPWRPSLAHDVLRLPGIGALVPDIVLTHSETGEQAFIEVLGFWSRPAVWKRVELVEKGLPYRIVFCFSDRLRVSEDALPDDAHAALCSFKGALSASKVLERIERVAR